MELSFSEAAGLEVFATDNQVLGQVEELGVCCLKADHPGRRIDCNEVWVGRGPVLDVNGVVQVATNYGLVKDSGFLDEYGHILDVVGEVFYANHERDNIRLAPVVDRESKFCESTCLGGVVEGADDAERVNTFQFHVFGEDRYELVVVLNIVSNPCG